jgi:hypothetical protein
MLGLGVGSGAATWRGSAIARIRIAPMITSAPTVSSVGAVLLTLR